MKMYLSITLQEAKDKHEEVFLAYPDKIPQHCRVGVLSQCFIFTDQVITEWNPETRGWGNRQDRPKQGE